jgi:hypothetical protein
VLPCENNVRLLTRASYSALTRRDSAVEVRFSWYIGGRVRKPSVEEILVSPGRVDRNFWFHPQLLLVLDSNRSGFEAVRPLAASQPGQVAEADALLVRPAPTCAPGLLGWPVAVDTWFKLTVPRAELHLTRLGELHVVQVNLSLAVS